MGFVPGMKGGFSISEDPCDQPAKKAYEEES